MRSSIARRTRAWHPRAGVVGLVAAAAVGVVALALVQPSGFTVVDPDGRAGTVWLTSSVPGHLALLDGATSEVAVRVAVASPGDDIAAVQGRGAGFALDRTTGAVVRVDSGTWELSAQAVMFPGTTTALDAVVSDEAFFAFDRVRGLMIEADPVLLRTRGPVASLSAVPSPGSPVVDRSGALWVLDDRTGDVLRAQGSDVRVTEPRAARAGSGRLVLVEGAPVVVDLAERRAVVIDSESGRAGGPACLDVRSDDPTVRVAGSASTSEVYVVSGSDGVLRVTDLGSGACHAVVSDVVRPGSTVGQPIEESGRLFVPDYGTGQVVVVDLADLAVVAVTDPIVTPGSPFELLSHDGFVFYNDPASEQAGTISLDGGVRPVAKYDPESPGQDVHVPGADAAPPAAPVDPETGPGPDPEEPKPTEAPTERPSTRPPPTGSSSSRNQPAPSASRAAPAPPDVESDLEIVLAADPVARADVGLSVRAHGGSGVAAARWSFGDGTSGSDGTAVTHRWARAGPYEVVAVVTRAGGAEQSVRATVVVLPDARGVVFSRAGGPGSLLVAQSGQAPQTCDPACAFDVPTGTAFELSVQISGAQRLLDWGVQGCDASVPSCAFTLEDAEAVTVSFAPVATLTVVVAGPGTVTAVPGPPDGADPFEVCLGGQCVWTYPADTPVQLSAATSARFDGWSGACSGTSTCSLTLSGAGATASAAFSTVDGTPPAVMLAGGGRSVAVGSPGQTVTLAGATMSVGVTASATDPESAVTVTEIWETQGHTCTDGTISETIAPGLVGRPRVSVAASSVPYTVSFAGTGCTGGLWLASATAEVWAEAVSEGGRSKTALLIVNWSP